MPPSLMRGATAIADHLGLAARQIEHLDRQRQLPTFRLPGDSAPHATAGGLDEWAEVRGGVSDGVLGG